MAALHFSFSKPRRLSISTSLPINFQTPSHFYFLPFSLMDAVCLMLLLPDDLITHIIIQSIKKDPIIRFLICCNWICGTFRRISDSDEVVQHMSLHELRQVCRNRYVRLCLEQCLHEANDLEALFFEGMERLKRQQKPDKGLMLVKYDTPKDSSVKYFLAMMKYCCNPMDHEGMALLHEISGNP